MRGLTAGTHHTCAWSNEGRVRCWGQGTWAKLGYRSNEIGIFANIGDDEPASDGRDLDVGGSAIGVRAGAGYGCAILSAGGARCWGPFAGQASRSEPLVGYDIPPSWVEPVRLY